MNGMYETVLSRLKEQKGHEEVSELWVQIWHGYEARGVAGVEDVLAALMRHPNDQNDDDDCEGDR